MKIWVTRDKKPWPDVCLWIGSKPIGEGPWWREARPIEEIKSVAGDFPYRVWRRQGGIVLKPGEIKQMELKETK